MSDDIDPKYKEGDRKCSRMLMRLVNHVELRELSKNYSCGANRIAGTID
jgi:hypothetical protein